MTEGSRRTNKRASRYCDAPLLHWSGSPSNSRRPAVIRPATCPPEKAMGMPAILLRNIDESRAGHVPPKTSLSRLLQICHVAREGVRNLRQRWVAPVLV